MTLADLSIKRPIFITCVVSLILVLGVLSMRKLPVDLFPNITFPVVSVVTAYPGAGPQEVETLVSKVFEDQISTVAGVKRLSSDNREGISIVVAEFTLETDIKYAEQQIRDKVATARVKLPKEAKESVIRRMDPADQPIMIVTVTADLPEGKLFDLADQVVRPKIEQVSNVGLVEVLGGRKREIRVELDRKRLKAYEISASQVVNRLAAAGVNIPAGKVGDTEKDTVYRTLGEFRTVKDIEDTIVNFIGNDVPVTVAQVGSVHDTLEDEKSRTFNNGQKSLFLMIFKQTGANTIGVVDQVKSAVQKLNAELASSDGKPSLNTVRDLSKGIRNNVQDVQESIFIGILLTVIVVYFFLGSGRSTIITGLALPNSLLGAFILMSWAGYSINVMTLLAMSLAVGLLIDDAIVVRENIFRHIEKGEDPITAASVGTKEVTLAVIATTLAVISVFGPIAFLKGIVGQFFREFGMTICFAMAISLFDALTVAPMLSAYFAGRSHDIKTTGIWGSTMGRLLRGFNRFQDGLENVYEKILESTVRHPVLYAMSGVAVFVLSIVAFVFTPKTFLSAQDFGEFEVGIDMPPGTSLEAMSQLALKVDEKIRKNPEVTAAVLTVGNRELETNKATFHIELVPREKRAMNTSQFKDKLREQLKEFSVANPTVKDVDMVGGGMRPFNVNIVGNDLKEVEGISNKLFEKLKAHPGLKDPDISYRPGKPEFQVVLDNRSAEAMGVSTSQVGLELRTQIEGSTPAVFREQGREYDIRVRLKEGQRNLRENFSSTFVPNINYTLIRLQDVAKGVETTGPATIERRNRGRYIEISGDLTPGGPGMAGVMSDTEKYIKEIGLPKGMSYAFIGQAESFQELGESMIQAVCLAVIFIYLVLASLYESFITPFTIMLVLPLAICGAFLALFLTNHSHDLNSWIGCILLLGVATKNSILLVDSANQFMDAGMDKTRAIVQAGRIRLRPILMTTFALIAGMLPVAIGLNEASQQRTSMGIAVIGGLISSTLLSLIVVPACFSGIETFRTRSRAFFSRLLSPST
jgi:hydrophobic/amphiphilic exporter-1 (mainly G- bacteria), HAE1 family